MPQIWPPCHRFGKDLKAMPQIWQRDAKRYGDERKILLLCQHFISVLQVIRMLQEQEH